MLSSSVVTGCNINRNLFSVKMLLVNRTNRFNLVRVCHYEKACVAL